MKSPWCYHNTAIGPFANVAFPCVFPCGGGGGEGEDIISPLFVEKHGIINVKTPNGENPLQKNKIINLVIVCELERPKPRMFPGKFLSDLLQTLVSA